MYFDSGFGPLRRRARGLQVVDFKGNSVGHPPWHG
jgi:hypothetical protein